MKKYISIFLFLFTISIYGQFDQFDFFKSKVQNTTHPEMLLRQVAQISIGGGASIAGHDDSVGVAFKQGYQETGGVWNGTIVQLGGDWTSIFDNMSASVSNGSKIYIQSTNSWERMINSSSFSYPNLNILMPAGSNDSTYHTLFSVAADTICPAFIITGAGSVANNTSYDIEFFGHDYISGNWGGTNETQSSFSNGYIAGQIAYISNYLNVDIWTARYLARQTASFHSSYSGKNGYGKVNIADAIAAYNPSTNYTSLDPYRNLLVSTLTTAGISTTTTNCGVRLAPNGFVYTPVGICIGTSPNPTVSGTHYQVDTHSGIFLHQFTGLTPNTQYYYRGYATNTTLGTIYGADSVFTTNAVTPDSLVYDVTLTYDYTNSIFTEVIHSNTLALSDNGDLTYWNDYNDGTLYTLIEPVFSVTINKNLFSVNATDLSGNNFNYTYSWNASVLGLDNHSGGTPPDHIVRIVIKKAP